ncbi:MAG: DUF4432 family protein [Thermoguttaceae bacterium]
MSHLYHPEETVLLDTAAGVFRDPLTQSAANGDLQFAWERLRGGKQDGIDRVRLTSRSVSIDVLTTRGMSIASVGCGGNNPQTQPAFTLGWDSPLRGYVHPSLVPLGEPSGLGWLEGFSEWFVRCGLESNGAPEWDDDGRLAYPLHGRIANTPAHRVVAHIDERRGEVVVVGQMRESRLFFANWELTTAYRLPLNSSQIIVTDVVTNRAAEPRDFEMLYHINTGRPIVELGATIFVPHSGLAPRNAAAAANIDKWQQITPAVAGNEENVYFADTATDEDGLSTAMIASPNFDRGVAVTFRKSQCPCFSLWKCLRPDHDGYVVGLEPATNFPNPRSFEKSKGRTVILGAKESYTIDLTIDVLLTSERVREMTERWELLQSRGVECIWPEPQPEWTA